MSLQPITIDGHSGTVLYLGPDWKPVDEAAATMARVLFDDGSSAFYQLGSVTALGGAGSGNFGHAGRPGEIGGSASYGFNTDDRIPDYTGGSPDDRISKIQVIPIEQIEPTEAINETTVQSLMQAMQDGEPLPAIVTNFSGDGPNGTDIVSVVDGHQRLEAARRLGYTHVPVRVAVSSDDWPYVKKAGGLKIAGGPGSGNFGHSGRPGTIGGSTPDPDFAAWRKGDGVTDGDVADAAIAWTGSRYPRVPSGALVSALRVRAEVPNTDSIAATFTDQSEYDELPGIREVSTDDLDVGAYGSADDNRRVATLAEHIKESGEIAPLIVVMDAMGKPYVLEGNHRARALARLGKKTVPAVVLVDHTGIKEHDPAEEARQQEILARVIEGNRRAAGGPGSGNFGHAGRPGEQGGSSSNPMSGEQPGEHTPAAQARVISYLERETGMKFQPHGSLKRGATSKNDMDIVQVDPTKGMTKEQEAAYLDAESEKANIAESEAQDRIERGESTYADEFGGEYVGPVQQALAKIGFEPVDSAAWLGIQTIRYENKKTGHTIEIWERGDDQLYGLGGPGSGNFGHAGRPGEVGGSGEGARSESDPRYSGPVKTKDGKTLFLYPAAATGRRGQKFDARVAIRVLRDKPIAEVSKEMFGALPTDTVITVKTETNPDTLVLQASSPGAPASGVRMIREISREGGELVAHHSYFSISSEMQGQNLAKQVMRDQVDTYKSMGVLRVETEANLDVGGYAWARFGYKAQDPGELSDVLLDRLSKSSLSEEQQQLVQATILDYRDDPELPWHIAGLTDGGEKIGKSLMLNSSWDAELDLHDKEAMARFDHYVNR